jgi:putative glycosyltransferase (TIGR04372 family)
MDDLSDRLNTIEVLSKTQDSTETQLQSLMKLSESDPLSAHSKLLDFIKSNSDNHTGYFALSGCLYLLGRYFDAMFNYKKGMDILESNYVISNSDLFKVRFISSRWAPGHIGHAGALEYIVKGQKLEIISDERRVVVIDPKWGVNLSHLKYFEKFLDIRILRSDQVKLLTELSSVNQEHLSIIKMRDSFVNYYSAANSIQLKWEELSFDSLLSLSEEDQEYGLKCLKILGLSNNDWFVALHVRTGDNRRHRSAPNADIETYREAVNEIIKRGGWIIRMGHKGMKPFGGHPRIIDYANSDFKNSRMDVYLWASCKFMIGTSSGPLIIPTSFGRPVIHSNAPAIGLTVMQPRGIMLPKLYWSNRKNRLFTFQELFNNPLGYSVSSAVPGLDYEIIDNSPTDLKSSVIEMFEMIESKSFNLSQNQEHFSSLQQLNGSTSRSFISDSFLKQYPQLY